MDSFCHATPYYTQTMVQFRMQIFFQEANKENIKFGTIKDEIKQISIFRDNRI